MDEKKIKQIISNNIDLTKEVIPNSKLWSSENTLRVFTERCIKTAIQEFLKGLWHDASEEPKGYDEWILIQYSVGDYYSIRQVKEIIAWKRLTEKIAIKQWAYLDDLLEQKGGE